MPELQCFEAGQSYKLSMKIKFTSFGFPNASHTNVCSSFMVLWKIVQFGLTEIISREKQTYLDRNATIAFQFPCSIVYA